jgi:uncharacterized protein
MASSPSPATSPTLTVPAQSRLNLSLGLIAATWLAGLIGHFTPLAEWPALVIYVLGSIGITLYHCRRYNDWQGAYVTRRNLKAALIGGVVAGGAMAALDLFNTYIYYRNGGAPMTQMENILVGQRLMFFLPLLAVAEEFLWRGMLFSALIDRGWNRFTVVALTSIFYLLNHYAVAPVSLMERTLMAAMGIFIAIPASYLVLRTKNTWAGVTVHGFTFISMLADIFLIPHLV